MSLFNRDPAAPQVGPDEARRLVAEEGALLLDVREPSEWQAGHAPEAVHVPLGSLSLDDVAGRGLVVAVCRSGSRSDRAAQALQTAGVEAVNLAGGMSAWAEKGLPVIRDDGSPGTVA
jgi:rhodanese-related sulfurtransferase